MTHELDEMIAFTLSDEALEVAAQVEQMALHTAIYNKMCE